MVIYRDVWLCIGVHGAMHGCMVMYGGVIICMRVHVVMHGCIGMSRDEW